MNVYTVKIEGKTAKFRSKRDKESAITMGTWAMVDYMQYLTKLFADQGKQVSFQFEK